MAQFEYKTGFHPLLLFVFFIVPSFGLTYTIQHEDFGDLTLPLGQYLFFFISFLIGAYVFFTKLSVRDFEFLNTKSLKCAIIIFVSSAVFSHIGIKEFRIFTIIFLISIMTIIIALYASKFCEEKQIIILVFLLFPFVFPCLLSLIFEWFSDHPFLQQFGEMKHTNYTPSRWHFLHSSANGFGFSASISFSILFILFQRVKQMTVKILLILLCFVCLFTLIKSGTRAAYIFAIIVISTHHIYKLGIKNFIVTGLTILGAALLLGVYIGTSEILEFFRLEGSLNTMSSLRWQGIVALSEQIYINPWTGVGFGDLSNLDNIKPKNIFYLGIALEVGVIGAIAIVYFMFSPIVSCFRFLNVVGRRYQYAHMSHLEIISVCVLVGFIPYLCFEFNVLRVSAVNQLFFFFWGCATISNWKRQY